MSTSMTFYVPRDLEHKLTTLSGIFIHKMPTRPRCIAKAVRFGTYGVLAVTDNGKVYGNRVNSSGCYIFINKSYISHMGAFKALHSLGVLPDDEMKFLESLESGLIAARSKEEDMARVITLISHAGFDVPDAVHELHQKAKSEVRRFDECAREGVNDV